MSKKPLKGNTMRNENEPKPVVAVENDFGPVTIDGKQGSAEARQVELPKDPSPRAPEEPAPEAEVADDVADFLVYFNGELAEAARRLGYEITARKVAGEDDEFRGPTMRYDPETEEGHVFSRKADVPAGWLSNDQLNEKRAAACAE